MKYVVDIDGTICYTKDSDYYNSKPNYEHITKINELYMDGHTIVYWTARGANSGIDWTALTKEQLFSWGVKYHNLWMQKPHYDVWVDDKADWIFEV